MNNLLFAYNKQVRSRLTYVYREPKERDSMVNAIFLKKTRNVHCHSVDGGNIENTVLKNLLSAYGGHVGSRSTDAHREPMKRDPPVNDFCFIRNDVQRALSLRRWK